MTLALADTASAFSPNNDAAFSLNRAKLRFAARAKAAPLRLYQASPEIGAEHSDAEQIFDAIQSLYLSGNRPRDRQIAERITELNRDAVEEEEHIRVDSIKQFTAFFLRYTEPGFPRITLTPSGTIRVRWIHGPGHFAAIEFTGKPQVKLVAEMPGDNTPAQYFVTGNIYAVMSLLKTIGASLA